LKQGGTINTILKEALAEQGERIRNTWIFLHSSVTSKLEHSKGVTKGSFNNGKFLIWEATEDTPEEVSAYYKFERTGWFILTNVCSKDISFSDVTKIHDPEEIIFVKMEGA
jgi:hypothetical protein